MNKSLVIFGDSHYVCLRRAHVQGLVDLAGLDIEYWGHLGRRFKYLSLQDGAIVPTDDFTAHRFAKFNEKGRELLRPDEFDMVMFMGARIDLTGVMLSLSKPGFVTRGLKRRMIRDRLEALTCYRFAQCFAASQTAQIVISPVSYATYGTPKSAEISPLHEFAAETRQEINALIGSVMAEDDITLIPQPEETVVDGLFTRPEFAVERHVERNDYAHRNEFYGALIYEKTAALLRAQG